MAGGFGVLCVHRESACSIRSGQFRQATDPRHVDGDFWIVPPQLAAGTVRADAGLAVLSYPRFATYACLKRATRCVLFVLPLDEDRTVCG